MTASRRPLPFCYQSTGVETRFTNLLEPDARSRPVFAFHKPETFSQWIQADPTEAVQNAGFAAASHGAPPTGDSAVANGFLYSGRRFPHSPQCRPPFRIRRKQPERSALAQIGPTSPAGKAKSSLNAFKTALTRRTVLLPTRDGTAHQHHVHNFETELKPATPRESALVESLADTAWRLDRIPSLEYAIYARGCMQFADQFKHHDPTLRARRLDGPANLSAAKT